MKIRTRAITMTAIILAFSMMSVPGLIGSQRGLGVAQGLPTELYPVTISLGDNEIVFFATHKIGLADGNWIELSGGTTIKIPSMSFVYMGPDIDYTKGGATVKMDSSVIPGQVTYPLDTHQVYKPGQTVSATFCGSTDLGGKSVSFMLLRVSSLSEIKDVLDEGFLGIINTLLGSIVGDLHPVTLNSTGDGSHDIDAPAAGDYILVVANIDLDLGTPLNSKFYIYSATAIEVVDYTLDVPAAPSVEKGTDLNIEATLIGASPDFYTYGFAMIKESSYTGNIKLVNTGTISNTELHLNNILMAKGDLFTDFYTGIKDQSDLNITLIEETLNKAFSPNELSFAHSTTGSTALSTSSLTPGNYILFAGAWKDFETRTVGLYQTNIMVTSLGLPVADAGGPYSGKPNVAITFDGTGSSDPGGNIVSYAWNFGDGKTGADQTTSHAYSSTGTYTVTLTVTDDDGLTDIDTTTATISKPPSPPPFPPMNMKPTADAGPNVKIPVNATIHFTGSRSHDKDGYIISYSWDFGDGTTATEENVSNNYIEPGHYTVTLTVKDNKYAQDSDTCEVMVWEWPAPVADKFGQLVPGEQKGFKVNALKETNTTITLNTTDQVTVTILKYDDAPHPDDPIPATAIQIYVDVDVSDPDAIIWPIYVEMHYTDEELEGLDEYSLGIYYWMDDAWHRCSDTGVDTDANVVWAYMTEEEASGSPILMGGMPAIEPPPLPPFLDNLKITPVEVELGDEVTISFDIMNPNNQTFNYIVTMKIGELTLLVDSDMEAYESKTLSRTITPDTVGDYEVTVDGMTGSFTVKAPTLKPAEFVASDLTITPEEVDFAEEVEISFTVTNIGELPGDYAFNIGIEGPLLTGSVEVTGSLEAGKSHRTSYMLGTNVPGTYSVEVDDLKGSFTMREPKPAEFEVTSLSISPDEVEPDATVTVSATITNIGDESGGLIIEFKLDGMVVDTKSVDLNGGESETVTFTTSSESEGSHSVEIEALSGSFTVEAPPKDNLLFWFAIVVVLVVIALYMIWKKTDWIDQLRAKLK